MSELPDRGWAAFTEQGPWSLVRNDIRWMPVAADLRAAARQIAEATTGSTATAAAGGVTSS